MTVQLMTFSLTDPTDAAALSTGVMLGALPIPITIVGVSVCPLEDDAGATIDIQDDGTDIITAVDASDADVPGTWLSTHLGGTNAPVEVAADSELEIDFNSAAAGNHFNVIISYLPGERSS